MNQSIVEQLKAVEMEVTVRFGATEMPLRDVAALGNGSMVELNRTVDEPVELLINDFPFARGEVVVVDGYYSVKITEVSPKDQNSNVFLLDSLSETGMGEDWKPQENENDAASLFEDATGEDVINESGDQSTDESPSGDESDAEEIIGATDSEKELNGADISESEEE